MTANKKAASNRRHIPVEIVEEILLYLPVKSVLRFSSVSKSWRSMISQPRFIRRYGGAAALCDRERLVISSFFIDGFSSCSISSILSDQMIHEATKIVSPFKAPQIIASCDELWCVEFGKSLFLWNPSMNTYTKVADSPRLRTTIPRYYGLGYDSVVDDYKILKLSVHNTTVLNAELYSLRKDSWRNIKVFPDNCNIEGPGPSVFVNGALNWIDHIRNIIVYFNLTTEMYGELVPPTQPRDVSFSGVICLRRKLYTYFNDCTNNCSLWVMEDYGVDKPWTKVFAIRTTTNCGVPYFRDSLTPLYHYDNGDILIDMRFRNRTGGIFILKKGDTVPKKIVHHGNKIYLMIADSFVYVEGLASPAAMQQKAAGAG